MDPEDPPDVPGGPSASPMEPHSPQGRNHMPQHAPQARHTSPQNGQETEQPQGELQQHSDPAGQNGASTEDSPERQGEHVTFSHTLRSASPQIQETTPGETVHGQQDPEDSPDDPDNLMTPFHPQPHPGKRKRGDIVESTVMKQAKVIPEATRRSTREGRAQHEYRRLANQRLSAAAAESAPKKEKLKDPTSLTNALGRPDRAEWVRAVRKEFTSLEDTECVQWIHMSKVPKGRKLLSGKWVLHYKYVPDGTIEKRRARWTVKGFTQRLGMDYVNTFAPTPRHATSRILLALCIVLG
ncbi:uncharacterized protein CLAFUR5_08873 [Fulvia fulva]|uniref:Reverse transcriptase Ty1/copia-type domain-containing protein n=1 Tax=Passalora fulva TaxID=5499 RepID=A0A9Q8PGP6_PASFU|nr:uncharacterized protein CLAFUR5_08873 [Fulvia fulva]UJO22176.1 hypothetical protein CLAFUR5_08873 [Fulvia fulva]